MKRSLLEAVNSPKDIKNLTHEELRLLAQELREIIIETIAQNGGHLAPSLGVVELTLALHYVFDTPDDQIVWDVGHQCYAHKLLTGRKDRFHTIRCYKGISGFPKPAESEYDAFGVGHSSTAISAAFGMACARDLKNERFKVIAVVGDGALTGGLAYEGLNNAGASGKDFIVILNDNSMSISPNVGAISNYLTSIIANPVYNRIKSDVWELTGKMESMGPVIRKIVRRLEESLKAFITPGVLFERLGFRYFGPVDGHDIGDMITLFQEIKNLKGPLLVHVITKKGKGYPPAEQNATVFHGLGKFDLATGEPLKTNGPTYTQIFGQTIVELAEREPRLIAITAAMSLGSGLSAFSQKFPTRFFDVGIAEGHAVTFAAGLAKQGMRPFFAVYSSFLQRAFDMVIHDVALQNLPVVFCIDRGGLVGDDGPTHHGTFDLAYLRTVPDMVIMAPKDENELRHMLYTALSYESGPCAVRYPRGEGWGIPLDSDFTALPLGKAEILESGESIVLLALGSLVYPAWRAAQRFAQEFGKKLTVVNARFVKPLDGDLITDLAKTHRTVVTLEEGTLNGGFGSAVAELLADRGIEGVELIRLGIPDQFIEQGERHELLAALGLTEEGIYKTLLRSRAGHHLIQRHKILPSFLFR
ncbi:MAG: 1-deoxy-D-xylulose-5-phosphate synthase [candidate division KSB1 bacterium]|nr:1-deoxy-D-xylulose-5-phosphate synthase [candidate division KSB1 bacterium]MDZ7345619.1 1-deoxy-D-xylulose-5-phosphate synthase [candidate division KSB1 bacterium]